MRFARIEPGTFMMGTAWVNSPIEDANACLFWAKNPAPDRELQHQVTLTKPFFVGIYDVTRGQFAKFAKDAPYATDNERLGLLQQTWRTTEYPQTDDHPVVYVSYNDALAFIIWLNDKHDGHHYRLPTEAVWEYACRAGTTTSFYTGQTLSTDQANYDPRQGVGTWVAGTYRGGTTPVGTFKPNPWGLYDMLGNVYQYCATDFEPFYAPGLAIDPPGNQDFLTNTVMRGGSFGRPASSCRSASRSTDNRIGGDYDSGFRVCADVE
jgi:formylglycine-generating enzyme required for sulfatase activity